MTTIYSPSLPAMLKEYRVNFYGSKKHMLGEILSVIPEGTETIADLCAGTGVVSWTLKQNGFQVISNDFMRYPSIRMKALIENQNTVITENEFKMMLRDKKDSGELPYPLNEYSVFLGEQNSRFMEAWMQNLSEVHDPVKRAVLIHGVIHCIYIQRSYAAIRFGKDKKPKKFKDLKSIDLENLVHDYLLTEFPKFLHDNGKCNQVFNQDAVSLVSKIYPDVVYIDPPYAADGTAYEGDYALFDDLVLFLNGEGHKILNPFDYKCELGEYVDLGKRDPALHELYRFFHRASHIPCIIVSYSDTCKIRPVEIEWIAQISGRSVETKKVRAHLASTKMDSPKKTTEHLIRCDLKAA